MFRKVNINLFLISLLQCGVHTGYIDDMIDIQVKLIIVHDEMSSLIEVKVEHSRLYHLITTLWA